MKKDTNLLDAQDVRAEAATALTPNATNGEKIKALRTAQGMSMAELSRRASCASSKFVSFFMSCLHVGYFAVFCRKGKLPVRSSNFFVKPT